MLTIFVALLQADIAVLDEIDSGLDIDALRDVADAVNSLKRPDSATLMVTHYKVAFPRLSLSHASVDRHHLPRAQTPSTQSADWDLLV